MNKLVNTRIKRAIAFTIIWFAFWFLSTKLYMSNIHDVGGTFWSVGVWFYPVALIIFIALDKFFMKRAWAKNKPIVATLSTVILTLLSYPLGMYLILFTYAAWEELT